MPDIKQPLYSEKMIASICRSIRTGVVVVTVTLWLLPYALARQISSAMADNSNVEALRKEARLPDWANYVCYSDAKGIRSGWFMVIGYSRADDLTVRSAEAFGYARGLTYQEYLASDKDVMPLNMPVSPEDAASAMKQADDTHELPMNVILAGEERIKSLQNAIALVKAAARLMTAEQIRQNEPEKALLDAPDGTNFRSYMAQHSFFPQDLQNRQKYYNAGFSPALADTVPIFREGNLLFEKDFASGFFETAVPEEMPQLMRTQIQMQETDSGLRFVMASYIGNSAFGIPRSGKCEAISTRKTSARSQ